MNNNELIDSTINILKIGGLAKFTRGNRKKINSPHCILGAFDCCLPENEFIDMFKFKNLLVKIRENIPLTFPKSLDAGFDLAWYNNNKNTSLEDIINLLERTKDNV
jgi:hypothetical protein